MGKSIVIAMLLLSLSGIGRAQDGVSDATKALVDTLLDQTGQSAMAVGQQFSDLFIAQLAAGLRQTRPDIDPKAFSVMEDEVRATINEELLVNQTLRKMMYPIYDKHFTDDELAQMVEFNKTPLGQKLLRVMPQVSKEGLQAGQAFGQAIGPKIQSRIAARFEAEGIQ